MWLGYNQYAAIRVVADKLHKKVAFYLFIPNKGKRLFIPSLVSAMENWFCFELTSGPYSRHNPFDCKSKNDDTCLRTIWFLRLHLADF